MLFYEISLFAASFGAGQSRMGLTVHKGIVSRCLESMFPKQVHEQVVPLNFLFVGP